MLKARILIMGAGQMGRVLGGILSVRQKVDFWDKDFTKVSDQRPLADVAGSAKFIFLCVPSWCVRDACLAIAPYLNKNSIIVSLAKGLEVKSNKFIYEVVQGVLGEDAKISILGGSMIAEELSKGLVGFGIFSAKSKTIFNKISKIFLGTNLELSFSSDLKGVALGGVLKNIYAIALGIADGLGWGLNVKGAVVSQALKEMEYLAKFFKIKIKTMYGIAGLGDLVATGFSLDSRNRAVGYELAKTGVCCLESEGIISLRVLAEAIIGTENNLPIFFALKKVVMEGGETRTVFGGLIKDLI